MNYYEVLQVSPNAEAEVIQAAYRRLSLKYHPDRNYASSECDQKMRHLNAAYEVLSDPARRAEYDRDQRLFSGSDARISFICPHCHNTVSQISAQDGDICLCPACHCKVRLRKKNDHKPAQEPPQAHVDELWKSVVDDSGDCPGQSSPFTKQAIRSLREKHNELRNVGNRVLYAGAPILLFLFLLILLLPTRSGPQLLSGIFFLLGLPGVWLIRVIVMNYAEGAMESVNVTYRFTDRTKEGYTKLIEAIGALTDTRVWTLKESQNGSYARSSDVVFSDEVPRLLESNVEPKCLRIETDKYWFFPDCVLSFEDGQYYISRFGKFSLDVEDISVKDGKEVAGYRWLHSRVDGGQDRRFRVNYQIPIYRLVYNTYRALILNIDGCITRLIADNSAGKNRIESLVGQFQHYCALLSQSI